MRAAWKLNLYNADPGKVAYEIMSIGNSVTPEQVVEAARVENSELHKCFDWDDSIAADKWRKQQAGDIIRNLIIERTEDSGDKAPIRMFYKTSESSGYVHTALIVKNQSEYEALLQQAYAELRAFKRKYSCLSELDEILALID